jgi:hypothetical protein
LDEVQAVKDAPASVKKMAEMGKIRDFIIFFVSLFFANEKFGENKSDRT